MDFFTSLDLFGSHLHFFVNHKKKLYTPLGGILTSISSIICASLLVYLLKEFFGRDNPQITENDEVNNEYKKIKFGEEKIYIPWSIGDYHNHYVNFTGWIYPIIYYYYGEKNKITDQMIFDYKILNYTYCNETNLNKNVYFDDYYVDFDKLYCINMDDLIMGGNYLSDFVYHIQFELYLCEDGVNMGTEGKNCTDYDKLTEYIGANNAWHIELYYPEVQFNSKSVKYPLEIFYNSHFYNFNKLNTKVERLYLKQFVIIDDKGWIFENKHNLSLWGYDKMESDSYLRILEGNDFITDLSSSKLYSLVIYLNKHSKIFTRKYTKFLDAVGNILSIVHGIFILFKFSSQFFTEAYQDKDIVNNIFVQKYFMNEKFNEYNNIRKNLKQKYSTDFYPIFHKNASKNENLYDHNINSPNKNLKNQNILHSKHSIISLAYNTQKKNKENKILSTVKNNKKSHTKSKYLKKPTPNIISNLQKNLENSSSYNSINNSSNLKMIPQKAKSLMVANPILGLNIKNCHLHQIKNYIKKDHIIDKDEEDNQYGSKDFDFPYYLYLLNIFNKIFPTTKKCCVNYKFLDAWEYLVEVFDVVKFIELQTNMDLINRIIFELGFEGAGSNIKNTISKSDKFIPNISRNNNN